MCLAGRHPFLSGRYDMDVRERCKEILNAIADVREWFRATAVEIARLISAIIYVHHEWLTIPRHRARPFLRLGPPTRDPTSLSGR